MKRLVVDLDNTLTQGGPESYTDARPNFPLIEKIREYKSLGFEIVINTSRNMRSHEGNIGKINIHTLPVILEWLEKHDIPHDEVYVGKPWCGLSGFYVDDRAVRPSEFINSSYDELRALVGMTEDSHG
jgi:capsule biosynthesis phosphatase